MLAFLNYVEIKTKITSVLTFIYTMAFFRFVNWEIKWLPTLIFFVAMLLFDLTATSINNYVGASKEDTELPWSKPTSRLVTLTLLAIATGLGLWLVALTNIVVLLLGVMCFLCGILYSAGPIPIIRLPFGEVLSGFFYGFVIPAIFFAINLPATQFVELAIVRGHFVFGVDIVNLIYLVLLGIVPFAATSNIMLANNLCDLAKDESFGRYTLPHYLGKRASLIIYRIQAVLPFVAFLALTLIAYSKMNIVAVFGVGAVALVWYQTRKFCRKQNKSTTFVCSLVNFIVTLVALSLSWFVASLL